LSSGYFTWGQQIFFADFEIAKPPRQRGGEQESRWTRLRQGLRRGRQVSRWKTEDTKIFSSQWHF